MIRFNPRDRLFKRLFLARDVFGGNRRLDGPQLAEQGLAGAIIDRPARLRRGRRQARHGPRQKWVVIGHFAFRPSLRRYVNPDSSAT